MEINPGVVLRLLNSAFPSDGGSTRRANQREKDIAKVIEDILVNAQDEEIDYETYNELEHDDDYEPNYEEITMPEEESNAYLADDYEDTPNVASGSDYSDGSSPMKAIQRFTYAQKKAAVDYWQSGKKQLLKLETVQKSFRYVSSRQQLYKWKEQVANYGTQREKYARLAEEVYQKFRDARSTAQTVHDRTLQRWALQINSNLISSGQGISNFKASSFWLYNFKKTHRIRSRKVTKVVTTKRQREDAKIKEECDAFVAKVRSLITPDNHHKFWNTDQSGLDFESRYGRTHEVIGEKVIEGLAQSASALTHSDTILPTISLDGRMLKTLMVLHERPLPSLNVQSTMYKAPNLVLAWSTSGKMDKISANNWMKDVFAWYSDKETHLMFDSWTGWNDKESLFRNVDPDSVPTPHTVPEGGTSLVQPLDVGFFRPFKAYRRELIDRISKLDPDFSFRTRNNRIKLASILLYQFQSPRFEGLIIHAWKKSGYISDDIPEYPVAIDFSFNKNNPLECDNASCFSPAIIRCTWCKGNLCFNHLWISDSEMDTGLPPDQILAHYCYDYVN